MTMSNPNDKVMDVSCLRQGIDYRFPVSLRGKKYILRPLSIIEEDRMAREVRSEMHAMPECERNSMSESIRMSTKKLEIASTSGVNKNDPTLPVAETENWLPADIDYVFKMWSTECEKANPSPEHMQPEEISRVVDALKKSTGKVETIMTGLSFYQLVDISAYLLTQEKSQTDKSLG